MQGTIRPTPEILKEVNLFSVFSEAELQKLIQLGQTVKYEEFSNIVIEGELSWGMFLILDGTVGVFKNSTIGGGVYDVGQLEKGSFFGEMSLVDEDPRSATCRALCDVQVFFISKEAFTKFLNKSPDLKLRFYQICTQNLVKRLRDLNDHYVISQYQLWKRALNKKEEAA